MHLEYIIFHNMFNRFPRLSTAIAVAFVSVPYAYEAKQFFDPPPTYSDGLAQGRTEGFAQGKTEGKEAGHHDGYKQARQELQDQARRAVAKTFAYVEEDARRKSSNEPLDQAHLLGKIEIAVAPRWTLSLLGDTYVVRRPLRSDWNHAWFMTEQDSLRLDKDIYQLLQGTSIAVDKVKIESKKRLIAKGIEDLVTREANQCS